MRNLSGNVPWVVGFGGLQTQKRGLESGQRLGLIVEIPEKRHSRGRRRGLRTKPWERGHVRMVRREIHVGACKGGSRDIGGIAIKENRSQERDDSPRV